MYCQFSNKDYSKKNMNDNIRIQITNKYSIFYIKSICIFLIILSVKISYQTHLQKENNSQIDKNLLFLMENEKNNTDNIINLPKDIIYNLNKTENYHINNKTNSDNIDDFLLENQNNEEDISYFERLNEINKKTHKRTPNPYAKLKMFKMKFLEKDKKTTYIQSTLFNYNMFLYIDMRSSLVVFDWWYIKKNQGGQSKEGEKILNNLQSRKDYEFTLINEPLKLSLTFQFDNFIDLALYHRDYKIGDAYSLKLCSGCEDNIMSKNKKNEQENKEKNIHQDDLINDKSEEQTRYEIKFIIDNEDREINTMKNLFSKIFKKNLE
jgi:hypothetical protein